MLTGDQHWHHCGGCLVYCCIIPTDIRIIMQLFDLFFAFLGLRTFVIDSIIYPCQRSQMHLFSWVLRSWALRPCQLLLLYQCLVTILCERMCMFVLCLWVCACTQLLLHASLHGIWLPALSMSEVWARLSMLPLAVTGTSLVCRSPTGSGLAAH